MKSDKYFVNYGVNFFFLFPEIMPNFETKINAVYRNVIKKQDTPFDVKFIRIFLVYIKFV